VIYAPHLQAALRRATAALGIAGTGH
jgi:hypothetical protein